MCEITFRHMARLGSLLLWFSAGPLFSEQISVPLGEQTSIELPTRARSIDLSSSDLVSVDTDRDKKVIYVTGKKEGKGSFRVELIGDKKVTYDFMVVSILQKVLKEFGQIPGLKAVRTGSKITLSGRIRSKGDLNEVRQLKSKYPGLVIDTTGQGVSSTNTVVGTINRILVENDLANIQAHAYGRIVVLEGSAKDKSQSVLALRIAKMIYPGIENRISEDTNGGASISIEVLFVEVKKDNDTTVGFKQIRGDASVRNATETPIGAINAEQITGAWNRKLGVSWQVGGLSQFLTLIQERSRARVMSNPKLVARSGITAEFKAGETIFLNQSTIVGSQVVNTLYPVDAGVLLKITPKIDDLGQIDASISAEVSEFAPDSGSNPSKTVSNIETAVTIRDGQTVLLSGLLSKRNSKKTSRTPLLADIPIIGEIFKSRDLDSQFRETLILVTMNRVEADETHQSSVATKLWEDSESDISLSFFD